MFMTMRERKNHSRKVQEMRKREAAKKEEVDIGTNFHGLLAIHNKITNQQSQSGVQQQPATNSPTPVAVPSVGPSINKSSSSEFKIQNFIS